MKGKIMVVALPLVLPMSPYRTAAVAKYVIIRLVH